VSAYDVRGAEDKSAIRRGKRPAPLAVSKSVALVGTGLRAAGNECHRRHGWRVVRVVLDPWSRERRLSV